jgi:hypothetical protein
MHFKNIISSRQLNQNFFSKFRSNSKFIELTLQIRRRSNIISSLMIMNINRRITLWALKDLHGHITLFNRKWVIVLTVISMLSVSKVTCHNDIHSSFFLIAHWHIKCWIAQHFLNVLDFVSHVCCLTAILITYFVCELKMPLDLVQKLCKVWFRLCEASLESEKSCLV